jgi:hypothetical protein
MNEWSSRLKGTGDGAILAGGGSVDVLHVALLEQINPDLFLTRDKDQGALANARGFETIVVK